jgi:predicted nucleic acid-binding protein
MISQQEVKETVEKLKKRKSASEDNITKEQN